MTTLLNDTSVQRPGAKLVAGFGLALAIAGSLAPSEGPSIEGLATRVSVPLPDWLIIASVCRADARHSPDTINNTHQLIL